MAYDLQIIRQESKIDRKISFSLSPYKKISGIEKLTQFVIKKLLTSPNTDKFYPTSGAGLHSMPVKELTTNVRAQIVTKIKLLEEEIITSQINVNLPADERLKKLNILEIVEEPESGSNKVSLQIITYAGTITIFTL